MISPKGRWLKSIGYAVLAAVVTASILAFALGQFAPGAVEDSSNLVGLWVWLTAIGVGVIVGYRAWLTR